MLTCINHIFYTGCISKEYESYHKTFVPPFYTISLTFGSWPILIKRHLPKQAVVHKEGGESTGTGCPKKCPSNVALKRPMCVNWWGSESGLVPDVLSWHTLGDWNCSEQGRTLLCLLNILCWKINQLFFSLNGLWAGLWFVTAKALALFKVILKKKYISRQKLSDSYVQGYLQIQAQHHS